VQTKGEFISILNNVVFVGAKVIQLVEIMMDKFDTPETLVKLAELS